MLLCCDNSAHLGSYTSVSLLVNISVWASPSLGADFADRCTAQPLQALLYLIGYVRQPQFMQSKKLFRIPTRIFGKKQMFSLTNIAFFFSTVTLFSFSNIF